MLVMQYTVTYRNSTEEAQQDKIFYTPEAARAFQATVELWGGVSIIMEEAVEEEVRLDERH